MIVWSVPARQDLRLIHQYIANDSKRYADRVIQDMVEKVEILSNLPYFGKIVAEMGEENIREICLYSYRIIYELNKDTIYIHGVIHKRRDFKPDYLHRM